MRELLHDTPLVGDVRRSARTARPGRQWWTVICLTAVSMLALIDKNLIQLMVGPIKQDLGLTDVQISVLLGAAFGVANIAAGLPAGWLADRVNRRGLVGLGVLIWSVGTAACGLTRSYAGLFAARASVGVGEGIIPPACYSLLRDGVDEGRRGRALAIYSTATTTGAGIALVIAGALIAAIAARGIAAVPLFGSIHPWQLALVIIGLVGLPMTLLVLTLPQIRRARTDAQPVESSFGDALRFFQSRASIFVPLLVYSVAHSMLMATMGAWVPALIGRKFGMSPQQLGPILGLLLIVCGPLGLAVVGISIDRLHKARLPGAAMVGLAGALVFATAGIIMPQVGSLAAIFWPVETLVLLATTPFLVVTAAVVTEQAPAHMTGKLMALFSLLTGPPRSIARAYADGDTFRPRVHRAGQRAGQCHHHVGSRLRSNWHRDGRSTLAQAIHRAHPNPRRNEAGHGRRCHRCRRRSLWPGRRQ